MKFTEGDLIRVKKTGEEGKVIRFLDSGMIEVEITNTKFPMYEDDLEHPYLHWFMQKNKVNKINIANIAEDFDIDKKKKKKDLIHHTPGYSLQFTPQYKYDGFEDMLETISIAFVNQTTQTVYVNYHCEIKLGTFHQEKLEILSYQTKTIHSIPYKIMLETPKFSWSIHTEKHEKGIIIQDELRIKSKKLVELISKMQLLNEKTFAIQIAEVDNPLNAQLDWQEDADQNKEAFDDFDFFETKPKLKPIYEVDLHIEKLVQKHKYLDIFEIVELQLKAFEEAMNHALKTGQGHLTIIHGVGNGTLKKEIHKQLRVQYDGHCYFLHDYMPKYGMGATQIFFH